MAPRSSPGNASHSKGGSSSSFVRAVFALIAIIGAFVLFYVVFDSTSGSGGGEGSKAIVPPRRIVEDTLGDSGARGGEEDDAPAVVRGNAEVSSTMLVPTVAANRQQHHGTYAHHGDNEAHADCPAKGDGAAAVSSVTLAGNRPVGTYLCEYFPDAPRTSRGCRLQCELPHRFGGSPFECNIVNKAEAVELHTADIVVNHFGPVPTKKGGKPYITLFYQGESKAADGKRALASYLAQYDRIISFSTGFKYRYSWVHRHERDLMFIRRGDAVSNNAMLGGSIQQWQDERKSAIAVFVSRCKKGGRDVVIKELSKYYTVHSFGKCAKSHTIEALHPDCAAIGRGRYPEKNCVFKKYKYVLALDNTREMDYVTEKVYHALLAGAIPVYDGAPNIDDFLPGGTQSVVLMQDFRKDKNKTPVLGNANTNNHDVDFEALAAHLKAIEGSRSLRDGYFRWRTNPDWSGAFISNLVQPEPTCEVCADALEKKRCSV